MLEWLAGGASDSSICRRTVRSDTTSAIRVNKRGAGSNMRPHAILISLLVLFTGCAELPLGPSVAVMPAPGKPFDLFVGEEAVCRGYAEQQVGISPPQAIQNSTATGAVAGTAIGAAAGGAIGAAFGGAGPGAAVGAGTGLLTGSAIGGNVGYGASWTIQRRYDIAYEQCMYAKGNQIPGFPTAYVAPPPPSPPATPPPS